MHIREFCGLSDCCPQAVKIGILESEIKQSGTKPEAPKPPKPEKSQPSQQKPDAPKVQVKMPAPNAREIEELTAQVKALTNSLSNAEVANAELSEAKAKLEGEIGGNKVGLRTP